MEVRRSDNIGNFSKGSLYFQPTADSMQEPADNGVSHHLHNMRVKMLSATSWEKGIFFNYYYCMEEFLFYDKELSYSSLRCS